MGGWGDYQEGDQVLGTRGGRGGRLSEEEVRLCRSRGKDPEPTDLIVQYKTLMSNSIGAEHTDSVFFQRNSVRDIVISAKDPSANVIVARESPIMVRYWKCQPYESLL